MLGGETEARLREPCLASAMAPLGQKTCVLPQITQWWGLSLPGPLGASQQCHVEPTQAGGPALCPVCRFQH